MHLGIDATGLSPDLDCHHLVVNGWNSLTEPLNVCIASIPTQFDPSLAPPGAHNRQTGRQAGRSPGWGELCVQRPVCGVVGCGGWRLLLPYPQATLRGRTAAAGSIPGKRQLSVIGCQACAVLCWVLKVC